MKECNATEVERKTLLNKINTAMDNIDTALKVVVNIHSALEGVPTSEKENKDVIGINAKVEYLEEQSEILLRAIQGLQNKMF